MYIENKGDQTKLSIVKGYLDELNVAAPPGSEFSLKLEDDTILKPNITSVAVPHSYASQGVVYTNYTFETTLDKETVTKLATHLPTFLRLPDLKSGVRDMVDKKYFKAMNVGVKYILTN